MTQEFNLDNVDVRNNAAESRFEARLGDDLALIEYQLSDKVIAYTHTEVPPAFEGKGVAAKMARAALEYAKEQGLMVAPFCPYIASYIKRHPEYQSITIDVSR